MDGNNRLISNNYVHRPLEGLLSIKKDEISDADIFGVISYLEKKISSEPEGRVIDLALLFYLIRILQKTNVDFFVKGGFVMQYYLGSFARPTVDVDIIINSDPDVLAKKLENELSAYNESISFKIGFYAKSKASAGYYYDGFTFDIDVFHFEQKLTQIRLDGIYGPMLDRISPVIYEGPEIVQENFVFKGVPKEYVMAEKIMAITNELPRPFKHAVDVYSLIHTDVDVLLLKHYLDIILSQDNEVRKRLGKRTGPYVYEIKEDKKLLGPFFWAIIQAGYNVPAEEMIKEINLWMEKNLRD